MPQLTLAHHGAFDWLYVVVPVVLVLWWVRRAEAGSRRGHDSRTETGSIPGVSGDGEVE